MANALNSATDAAGPQAVHIEHLWWLMLAVCTAVFVLVMAALATALWRRRSPAEERPGPSDERRVVLWVGGGVIVTGVILFGLLIASMMTDRRLDAIETAGALTLSITGRQWWWEVRYEDSDPSKVVTAANELHVPAGQPVQLLLKSSDVIHSFWAPSLGGKLDLIPGRDTSLWIQADKPGVYQGQCAEFCGHQHAHMRFLVIAQRREEFDAWLARQRGLAREPETDAEKRGRDVFMSTTCVMCHSIRGTPAGSRAGPDLTHLASRRTLAASTLRNTPENLRIWITDPQAIKPGSHMPANALAPEELKSLLIYLGSLQ